MTASLSSLDLTDAGGHDSDDVGGSPRLLSVAEIQQVLREVQARGHSRVATGIGAWSQRLENGNSGQPALRSERLPTAGRPRAAARATAPALGWGDTEGRTSARSGDNASGTRQHGFPSGEPGAGWIGVLAAHAGAGASTVALVISEAAAADGRQVHLVDTAHSCRSGLVAAASEELGTDVTGAWRRGLRTGVTIDRRAADLAPAGWPDRPVGNAPAVTVVDLGLAVPENLSRLAADGAFPVVVCRPTVPGVRLTEQLLGHLADRPAAIAAIGPSRWPGEVTSSLGPRLRALRTAGLVVPVPTDRRLQVSGLTSSPLPKSVRSAGHQIVGLLHGSHAGAP